MPVITIPTLGQYGLVADQPAHELPVNAFSGVANMRFKDGMAERFAGNQSAFTSPSITPYWVGFYATSSARYVVYAGLTKVFVDDGTTRTEITGTVPTGAIDDRWTGGVLGGVLIMNNGKDVPTYWGGTGTLTTLTGWDANWRADSIRPFKNYCVAVGVTKSGTKYPHMVKWSAAADPGTITSSWDETDPSKDAGEVDLAETTDVIVDQLVLGDVNIIYKEASMYRMEYIGGNDVFAFKRIPGNFGALARGCIANTPKGHLVLANGDLVLHNGYGEPESIISSRLKKWLFQTQIDSVYYKRSFLASNPMQNEVWICYPEPGQTVCTKALVWNWLDGSFGVRDLQNVTYCAAGLINYSASDSYDAQTLTYDEASRAYNQNDFAPNDFRMILATTAPGLYISGAGTKYGSSAISWLLERTGLAFDDPDTVKVIKSLTPRAIAANGTQFYIQFGGSMDAEVAPTWSDPVLFTVGTSLKAYSMASGKYLAIRLYGSQSQPVKFKSFDVDVQPMGKY